MNNFFLIICFSLFPICSEVLSSEVSGPEIKQVLEQELLFNYLPKLEAKWGKCGSRRSSCLKTIDQKYLELNLPQKNLCFPHTKCGFYLCMEEQYNCESVGANYFTKLAYPTCSAYEKNIKALEFSKEGVEWIYSVMVCLQKGLIDECLYNGKCERPLNENRKKTCDYITDFTLKFHPGCYIKSGIGVCHLPLKDKIAIWKTVNPFMTSREKQEAYKVIFECFIPKTN